MKAIMNELTINIGVNSDWNTSYRQAIERTKGLLNNLDNNTASDFVLGKGIGSVGQSYFQGDGKKKVIEWLKNNKKLFRSCRNHQPPSRNK